MVKTPGTITVRVREGEYAQAYHELRRAVWNMWRAAERLPSRQTLALLHAWVGPLLDRADAPAPIPDELAAARDVIAAARIVHDGASVETRRVGMDRLAGALEAYDKVIGNA